MILNIEQTLDFKEIYDNTFCKYFIMNIYLKGR